MKDNLTFKIIKKFNNRIIYVIDYLIIFQG